MFFTLLLLVLLIEIVRGFVRVVVYFAEWLQRGRSIDEEDLEPAVRAMVESDDALEREMARAQSAHGLARVFVRWRAAGEAVDEYLDNMRLGWYQVVIIFFIGCMAGLLLEEIWMLATAGLTENRVGLVWGPFSPIYGCGACLLTMVLWRFRTASNLHIFVVSALLGGGLEQTGGMVMENLFHAQSWTYLGLPDAITQWIAWRFLFAWGVLGLVWCRIVMPEVIYRIGEPTNRMQVVFVTIMTAFLVLDVLMTFLCFYRKTERDAGVPAQNPIESYIDWRYNDQFIAGRFQNLVIGEDLEPNK